MPACCCCGRLIDGSGLNDAISACLLDPRYVVPEQREMLAQRLLTIAASHEDLSDHDTLRDDPVLQTATGKLPDVEEPPAPPSTLCRLEQRVDRRALVEMSKLFVETFLKSFDKPPEQIILDVDATDDSIHGQQKGRFYHGCYRHYCFLPLDVCGRGL